MPLFISCHTTDPLYTESANRLRKSLDRFGLEHEIHQYAPLGTWRDNTCYKPIFLKSMLDKHRGRPLVWLDADAEVVAYPDILFGVEADCAAGYKDNELLSGTLFFQNNEVVRGLIKLWLLEIRQDNGNSAIVLGKEQRALARAVDGLLKTGSLLFDQLPFEYVCIFDAPRDGDPVILHHQLSRQGRELYGT